MGSYSNKDIFKYSSSQHAYTYVFRDSQLVYEIIETDSQKYKTLLWAWNRGRKNKPKFMLYHIMICQSVRSYPNKYIFQYSSSQHAYAHAFKNSQLAHESVETDSQKYKTLLWAWNSGSMYMQLFWKKLRSRLEYSVIIYYIVILHYRVYCNWGHHSLPLIYSNNSWPRTDGAQISR